MLNKRGKAGLHRCDEAGVPVRVAMPMPWHSSSARALSSMQ
jgi:hypothetical protein